MKTESTNTNETATESLFDTQFLSYTLTNHLPGLTTDYLNNERVLGEFFTQVPKPVSFEKAIESKQAHSVDRKVLVEVLKEQYDQRGSTPAAVAENLDLLLKHNAFTITTGHQLCLFTGPLYFIYKLVSAVVISRELAENYPGHHFVPVYWMATEDHDFAEINHLHLPGKTLSWERESGDYVGEMTTEGLETVLTELEEWMGDRPKANEVLSELRSAYLESPNLAQATAKLVDRLFGRFGLVVIDPNDRRLKNRFLDIMRNDLETGDPEKYVGESVAKLQESHKVQVQPRAVNLFYRHGNQRLRIDPINNREGFQLAGTDIQFSQEEMLAKLEAEPERFSPNVVLRPLYQETILPNLAYIGGGSEVAYWLELKAMFQHFKTPFPIIVVRNSATTLPAFVAKKMEKIGVGPEAFFQHPDQLIAEFVKEHAGEGLSTKAEQEAVKTIFAELAERVAAIDPTLKRAVEGEQQKSLNGLAQLEGKLVKAEKRNQETAVRQLQSLHQRFFPEGKMQERYDNFIPLYLQWGDRFIDELVANLLPFDTRMAILTERPAS